MRLLPKSLSTHSWQWCFTVVIIFLMFPLPSIAAAGDPYQFEVGDSVSYKIKVRLNQGTNWYSGYTETEREHRTYKIISINENEISWHFTDRYVWSSNEDPTEIQNIDQTFKTDAVTREYLENSFEGPAENLDYYDFDYFWIRIDPNVNMGENLRILGDNYQVTSLKENVFVRGKFVSCIQLSAIAGQTHQVNSYEYDSDGSFTYTFSETMYYDMKTGYLVKSEWNANVVTSQGNFHWREVVTLTGSSFLIPMNQYGYIFYSVLVGVVAIIIILSIWNYRRRIHLEVTKTWQFLEGKIDEAEYSRIPPMLTRFQNIFAPPFYSFQKVLENVKVLWNPLELPYESLLVEKDASSKFGLRDGLFLVIDPQNRIGIIDLLNQKMVSPKIFPIDRQNIYLLLKLALSSQAAENSGTIEELLEHAYVADLQEVSTQNRTAKEIRLLASSVRELQKYAKSYGWGRDYRGFYKYLYEIQPDAIVQAKFSQENNLSNPNNLDESPPSVPLKLQEIAINTANFAKSDRLIIDNTVPYHNIRYVLQAFLRKNKISLHTNLEADYQAITELMARRKVFDYTLGQAPLTPFSHMMKLYEVLNLRPERVLLIGDDDLLSVSLARKGIEVTVVEIDPYTCALIHGIGEDERLPITIRQCDLKLAMPEDIPDNFDIFVADPDFTPLSFSLFLARGLSKLRIGGRAIINFEGKRYQKQIALGLIEKFDLHIEDFHAQSWTYSSIHHRKRKIIDGTSYYRTGKYSHIDYSYHYEHDIVYSEAPYSSQLYILKKVISTHLPIQANEAMEVDSKNLYDL